MSIDLAMMMCVRDEEQFLDFNLRHHHRLGIERAYLFLDRPRDRSREIGESFPWVTVLNRSREPSEWTNDSFQNRCAIEALALARRDGVRWLLHLDADEFAWGENGGSDLLADGRLTDLVARAAADIDLIILRPREVIPLRMGPGQPFWRHVFFQDGRAICREILDPSTGAMRRLDKFFGHAAGKSMVRVSADVEPRGPHRWSRPVQGVSRRSGKPLRTERSGFHYHFVACSAAHWRSKYLKLAHDRNVFRSGRPVPFPKQSFKAAALSMSPSEIDAYYRRWVATDRVDAERYVNEGRAVKDERLVQMARLLGLPSS